MTLGVTISLASKAVRDHSVTGGVFPPVGIKWAGPNGVFPGKNHGIAGLMQEFENRSKNGNESARHGLYSQVP